MKILTVSVFSYIFLYLIYLLTDRILPSPDFVRSNQAQNFFYPLFIYLYKYILKPESVTISIVSLPKKFNVIIFRKGDNRNRHGLRFQNIFIKIKGYGAFYEKTRFFGFSVSAPKSNTSSEDTFDATDLPYS